MDPVSGPVPHSAAGATPGMPATRGAPGSATTVARAAAQAGSRSLARAATRVHDEERAYVLHTYPYSESSLIVEMFTRASGRVPLVAKGIKRPRSQGAALMQFQPFNVSWSGKGDLRTLKKAEWQGGVPALPPARLFCGFYLHELMLKLLARDDAHEHLFDCYEQALIRLAAHEDEGGVLRGFEKAMLRETGYALALTHDPFECVAVLSGARYAYVPGRGPRRLVDGESPGIEITGQTLIDIDRDDYTHPRTAAEAKLLMRMLVQHQMNGRPLATRQVFSQLLGL